VRNPRPISKPIHVPGILFLYHHPFTRRASTILEHVNAFRQYSRFKVWNVNTELGFPSGLNQCQFQAIVLHYSLFGPNGHLLDGAFLNWIKNSSESFKIALLQDEYYGCQLQFQFLNDFEFDCVYSLLEPQYFDQTYRRYTRVKTVKSNLPGYVSDDLIALGLRHAKPDTLRSIDIGYRGRKLSPYMGRGALEKYEIAVGFRERAAGLGLALDIEADEHHRIYGDSWYQFLGDCRAVLGVEAGVSIFDLEGTVRAQYERIVAAEPEIRADQLWERLLSHWEGNISYRTISPRHFEAAALRSCQILFEGNYSGAMTPMVHYIPLRKDFSNFDEVIRLFRDEKVRQELTENAYRDLIASGTYSYRSFIVTFDSELEQAGMQPTIAPDQIAAVDALLNRDRMKRELRARIAATRYYPFPGRRFVWPVMWQFLRAATKIRLELERVQRSRAAT
jgi:hypothetical protein